MFSFGHHCLWSVCSLKPLPGTNISNAGCGPRSSSPDFTEVKKPCMPCNSSLIYLGQAEVLLGLLHYYLKIQSVTLYSSIARFLLCLPDPSMNSCLSFAANMLLSKIIVHVLKALEQLLQEQHGCLECSNVFH